MKYLRLNFAAAALVVLSGIGYPTHSRAAVTPTADEIMQKAVERSAHRSEASGKSSCTYTKVTVAEELDSSGKATKREEKVFDVVVRDGVTIQSLREINGRRLDQAQLKEQTETETKVYKSLGSAKATRGDRRENLLTPDLVGRFDFTLVGQCPVNGRTAYELTFAPKSNAPSRRFMDRILARTAGKVWIDAEDFEIARADIHLLSSVDFFGGVLGSLKKMGLTVMRARLADGQWFSTSSSGDFYGRKLLDSVRIRTSSESKNFRAL